jgi:hypothetical protein
MELGHALLQPGALDGQRQVADAQVQQLLFGQRGQVDGGPGGVVYGVTLAESVRS